MALYSIKLSPGWHWVKAGPQIRTPLATGLIAGCNAPLRPAASWIVAALISRNCLINSFPGLSILLVTWINFSFTFDIKVLFIFLHGSNYPNFQLIRILCSTLYAVVSLTSNFSPRLELLGLTEVFSVTGSSATLFT